MKGTRHPHPHIDPRQPRDGTRPGTNPPVFAWKPPEGATRFRLTVARDRGFRNIRIDERELREPSYLPTRRLAAGEYFWRWQAGRERSEVFSFEITPEAAVVEVPPAGEWLRRMPAGHPRIYVRPGEVGKLRASRTSARRSPWRELRGIAESLLSESHQLAEPPFLPDWSRDYQRAFDLWYRAMHDSRQFVAGANTLALAYLASGQRRYARAACERMASVSRWDPEGSSHIAHNDEAHMSVIWHGPAACDWVWDEFTEEERALVVEQFRRRGEITYEHVHGRGSYGVTRFDSHSGREIVFLAMIALVFHEHIPDAEKWLDWLRPVLCGIWPIWAGDDGAWAEGPSYSLAYVTIMTMFASALKRGAGVDLYRRPFWRNHARWRQYILPPYAEWIGFGDHSERWPSTWRANADLVELIEGETGGREFEGYVSALRKEAEHSPAPPPERAARSFPPLRYLAPSSRGGRKKPATETCRIFPAAGWAAIRTDLSGPARDLALIFRSSPYGAFSHSHASNNDFFIHVAGRVMAMPSGYYDGYGSDHHAHWVWHTKSHNCLTLSDAPQLLRSHDSAGAVENAYEDRQLIYFRGNADASYRDRAQRCRRHLLFLKQRSCFVMVDEFLARPDVVSAVQWNIHSWNRFAVSEKRRSFRLKRGDSALSGHFMYWRNAFFTLTEGWQPPPFRTKPDSQWLPQHHLRFTTSDLSATRNLGVVLCPGHAGLAPPAVATERVGETEVAHIEDDLVLVNQGAGVEYAGVGSDALAVVLIGRRRYEIRDEGIVR